MSGPVFVGGTGRSGTTIVARVIGADPRAFMIPIESRFIVDPHGLCDVVAGTTGYRRFERSMRGGWWFRKRASDGATRGVHSIIDHDLFDRAMARLELSLPSDPLEAGRTFVEQLFDPLPQEVDAERWIEMTPPNVSRGTELVRLMGTESRVVHSIRDGRDVAASVSQMGWGPNDPFDALEWWADRMLQAHLGSSALDSSHLFVVQLEDLVVRKPTDAVEALARFIDLDPAHLEAYVDRMVSAERAHIGRWEDAVDGADRDRFNARYDELRDDLVAQGCVVPS